MLSDVASKPSIYAGRPLLAFLPHQLIPSAHADGIEFLPRLMTAQGSSPTFSIPPPPAPIPIFHVPLTPAPRSVERLDEFVHGDSIEFAGIPAWIPEHYPSGFDNFFGVNRSKDQRLVGGFFDGRGNTVLEGLTLTLTYARRNGSQTDAIFMGEKSREMLVKEIEHANGTCSWAWQTAPSGDRFNAVMLNGVPVFLDFAMATATAFVMQMNTWALVSGGDPIAGSVALICDNPNVNYRAGLST